jgi:hypothetical protein
VPFDGLVALLFPGERPRLARATDVSTGGLRILSRGPMPVGRAAALQVVHPDGRLAVLGAIIRHVAPTQRFGHAIGLQYAPVPRSIDRHLLADDQGRVRRLHALM